MTARDARREFAVEVVRTLQNAGFTALWAGGCVRDLLLGHASADYDVATSARPEQVQEVFGKRRTLGIGASFGVILVRSPSRSNGGDVEVATFRTEGPYLDGRRPQHVSFATPEEDAQRRDFTINGMFLDPLTDALFDYVGGRDDLERRVVRAIGDPRARFTEDKLRMLRAVRLTARFDFELDPATADAVRQMSGDILVVSGERIAQELRKMLVHPNRARALRLADELRLLTVIVPELKPAIDSNGGISPDWSRTLAMLERLEGPAFELAFAAVLYPLAARSGTGHAASAVETIGRRLRLSNKEQEHAGWLVANFRSLAGAPAWPLSRLKRFLAHPLVKDLLVLVRTAAECGDGDLADVVFCEQLLARTPRQAIDPPPLITGDDLIALGLLPGVQFKDLLDRVRDAQLEERIGTRDEALALIRLLLSSSG